MHETGARKLPLASSGSDTGQRMNEKAILAHAAANLPSAMMLLEKRGKSSALQCVAFGQLALGDMAWDNWDGGAWTADLRVLVPPPLYLQLAGDEGSRDHDAPLSMVAREITDSLREAGVRAAGDDGRPIHFSASVHLQPLVGVDAEAWKTEAIERLAGRGITNQGWVRSDNPAKVEFAGLRFRSQAEVNLFRAFQDLRVLVAPLPVFVRGTGKGSRFEPDFVVVIPPHIMVVEVDGPMHHEAPVEAHERLAELSRSGVHVERIRSDECHPMDRAASTAARLRDIATRLKH